MAKKMIGLVLTAFLSVSPVASSVFATSPTNSSATEPGEITGPPNAWDWWLGHYHYFGIGAAGGLVLSCAGLTGFCYGHSAYDRNHETLKLTCRNGGMGVFIGAGILGVLLGLGWGATMVYDQVTQ